MRVSFILGIRLLLIATPVLTLKPLINFDLSLLVSFLCELC